jgi:hypothetical protein
MFAATLNAKIVSGFFFWVRNIRQIGSKPEEKEQESGGRVKERGKEEEQARATMKDQFSSNSRTIERDTSQKSKCCTSFICSIFTEECEGNSNS